MAGIEGIIVLVAFSIAFVGIAIWAFAPRNKNKINAYGTIPFKEEDNGK